MIVQLSRYHLVYYFVSIKKWVYSCYPVGLQFQAVCAEAQLLFSWLHTGTHCGTTGSAQGDNLAIDTLHVTSRELGLCPCSPAQPAFLRQTPLTWMLFHLPLRNVTAYPLITTLLWASCHSTANRRQYHLQRLITTLTIHLYCTTTKTQPRGTTDWSSEFTRQFVSLLGGNQ